MLSNFKVVSLFRVVTAVIALSVASIAPAQVFSGSTGYSTARFSSMGRPINVEIYTPSIPGPRPAIVLLHGADGFTEYGNTYREVADGLAKAGFVTFMVHYFNSTGHTSFADRRSLNPRLFAIWSQTVADTVNFASRHPNVDGCRVGIMGMSLGGYLAVAVGSQHPQVKAVVELFGGVPDDIAPSIYRMPPTLIIHGEADDRVPVSEAYKLHALLSSRGLYNDIEIYPGQGHSLTGKAVDDAKLKVLTFLNCTLQ